MSSFFVTDEDDTPIVSLLQQQTASLEGRAVPVSAILFDESVMEPAIVPAAKIRKKRVKRVNWVYVPVNSTDLVHVSDFTIAAMAEPSVERSVEPTFGPSLMPTVEPRGEPSVESGVEPRGEPSVESGVERRGEPSVESGIDPIVQPSGEVIVGIPDPFRVLSPTFGDNLAQKFGVNAIGESVCRDFGPDGIFHGTITAYHMDSEKKGLYTVQYTDNDIEDLDDEEYNYAYSLWLEEEGWEVEEDDGAVQVPFVHTATHL